MSEWVSPVDGHLHFGEVGKAECAVCSLERERDRLREHADLLEDDLAHIALALAAAVPMGPTVRAEDAYDMLKRLVGERDRLRAVVEALTAFRAVLTERTTRWNEQRLDAQEDIAHSIRYDEKRRALDNALEALDAEEGT